MSGRERGDRCRAVRQTGGDIYTPSLREPNQTLRNTNVPKKGGLPEAPGANLTLQGASVFSPSSQSGISMTLPSAVRLSLATSSRRRCGLSTQDMRITAGSRQRHEQQRLQTEVSR